MLYTGYLHTAQYLCLWMILVLDLLEYVEGLETRVQYLQGSLLQFLGGSNGLREDVRGEGTLSCRVYPIKIMVWGWT